MNNKLHLLPTFLRLAPLAVAITGMPGCAIVESIKTDTPEPHSGMLYHLPKAVLPVELVARGGALGLRVLPAKQVVDPRKRYYLKHPANVFSSDNVKVEYDSSGQLLSKLTIDSTDETLNILKNVAKATAFGRAEAAAAAGEDILASGDYDPDDSDGLDGRGSNAPLMQDLLPL